MFIILSITLTESPHRRTPWKTQEDLLLLLRLSLNCHQPTGLIVSFNSNKSRRVFSEAASSLDLSTRFKEERKEIGSMGLSYGMEWQVARAVKSAVHATSIRWGSKLLRVGGALTRTARWIQVKKQEETCATRDFRSDPFPLLCSQISDSYRKRSID